VLPNNKQLLISKHKLFYITADVVIGSDGVGGGATTSVEGFTGVGPSSYNCCITAARDYRIIYSHIYRIVWMICRSYVRIHILFLPPLPP